MKRREFKERAVDVEDLIFMLTVKKSSKLDVSILFVNCIVSYIILSWISCSLTDTWIYYKQHTVQFDSSVVESGVSIRVLGPHWFTLPRHITADMYVRPETLSTDLWPITAHLTSSRTDINTDDLHYYSYIARAR